jgi:hypothetical protein
MQELAEADLPWQWPELAAHPDSVVLGLPALLLDEAGTTRWRQGSRIPATGVASGDCRAYSEAGEWLGIGRADESGQAWKPAKVIGSAS